jgi:hypothetical protein
MYGAKRFIGGKLSVLKPQLQVVNPLGDNNIIHKKVEEVTTQQPTNNLGKEKVIINNNLETKQMEPIKKTRNEKIMKFINFQI